MSNAIDDAVDAVTAAVQVGNEDDVERALASLEGLDARLLVAELFLQVSELAERIDVDTLRDRTSISIPARTADIVDAVRRRDLAAVQEAVSSDYGDVLVALLSIIAAMDDVANGRLGSS